MRVEVDGNAYRILFSYREPPRPDSAARAAKMSGAKEHTRRFAAYLKTSSRARRHFNGASACVIIFDPPQKPIVVVGQAVCSPSDTWRRRIGRREAFDDALSHLQSIPEAVDGLRLWFKERFPEPPGPKPRMTEEQLIRTLAKQDPPVTLTREQLDRRSRDVRSVTRTMRAGVSN